MKRLTPAAAIAILSLLAALAAGCGGGDDESEDAAQQQSRRITVGIDIPFHPLFNYVVGKKDEYFADKPYTVTFRFLDATTQVPSFGKGELDVMTTPPSFIPRVMSQYGIKPVLFFPLARWTPGPEILVPKDSPLSSLADLEGKRVAVPPLQTRFGSEEAAIIAVTGQNIREYFDIQETEAAAQQLTLGRVDAAFIEAPTTFPLLEGGKYKSIYSVQEAFREALGDPAVVNGGYIARKEFIAANRDFVDDLIAATQDAWNRYQENPDEVNAVASEVSGIPPEQLELVGKVLNLEDMPENLRRITPQDLETWKKLFPLLQKSGFIAEAPKIVEELFVVTR
jgi:ABC-type nitrate/sulfonate/bicarbonate transport system substrate-binding protein